MEMAVDYGTSPGEIPGQDLVDRVRNGDGACIVAGVLRRLGIRGQR